MRGRPWLSRPLLYCADLDRTPDEVRAFNATEPGLRAYRSNDDQKPIVVDVAVRDLCLWFDYADLHGLNPEHPTADGLAAFLESTLDGGASNISAERIATAVHDYNYTRDHAHLHSRRLRHTMRKIHQRPRLDVTVATRRDVQRMLDAAAGQPSLRRCRDRALIALEWATWLRAGEMERLAVEWCELLPKRVVIHIPDGNADSAGGPLVRVDCNHRARVCPVCALKEWLARAQITRGRVWRTVLRSGIAGMPVGHNFVNNLIREYCRRSRLKAIYGAHAFRRTRMRS